MTAQNPASPDGNRLRDIIFAAIVGVDCTTVHRARIMSEGLADEIVAALASAPRPDADAKLAKPVGGNYRQSLRIAAEEYQRIYQRWHELWSKGESDPATDEWKRWDMALDTAKERMAELTKPREILALLSLTERAASLEKENTQLKAQVREPLTTDGWRQACLDARVTASEALQECERLRVIASDAWDAIIFYSDKADLMPDRIAELLERIRPYRALGAAK